MKKEALVPDKRLSWLDLTLLGVRKPLALQKHFVILRVIMLKFTCTHIRLVGTVCHSEQERSTSSHMLLCKDIPEVRVHIGVCHGKFVNHRHACQYRLQVCHCSRTMKHAMKTLHRNLFEHGTMSYNWSRRTWISSQSWFWLCIDDVWCVPNFWSNRQASSFKRSHLSFLNILLGTLVVISASFFKIKWNILLDNLIRKIYFLDNKNK